MSARNPLEALAGQLADSSASTAAQPGLATSWAFGVVTAVTGQDLTVTLHGTTGVPVRAISTYSATVADVALILTMGTQLFAHGAI